MKHLTLAATLAALAAVAATAHADPYKLSADQQYAIFTGLAQLDGYSKIVKGPDGKDQVVKLPYTFGAVVRLTVARDLADLQDSIKVAQDAVKTATTGLPEDKAKAEAAKIAAESQPLDLRPIDLDALTVGDNPIPVSTLTLIMPIAVKVASPKS